jgi:hypothetical protein
MATSRTFVGASIKPPFLDLPGGRPQGVTINDRAIETVSISIMPANLLKGRSRRHAGDLLTCLQIPAETFSEVLS